MKKVCMLATIHPIYDSRIYYKESISLKKAGYDVHIVLYDNKTDDFISEDGINIHTIGIKSKDKITTFINKNRILKKALELKADIYHYHDFYINFLVPKLKKELPGSKIIYDMHEFFVERNKKSKKWYVRFFTKIMAKTEIKNLKYVDHMIVVVDKMKEKYSKYFNSSKIDVIYNYPLIDKKEVNKKCKKIYDIVYNGGIKRDRGILELLEAVHIGKKEIKNIKLLLLGPIKKDFKQILYEKIKILQIEENVDLLEVEHKKVKEYLCKSKIGINLLYPTYNNKYGLQIKIFEYMSQGIPLVINYSEIGKRIVNNEAVGELIENLNPEEIWKKIRKILNNKELYEKYSSNGLKAVINKYNWKLMEEKLLKTYRLLIN